MVTVVTNSLTHQTKRGTTQLHTIAYLDSSSKPQLHSLPSSSNGFKVVNGEDLYERCPGMCTPRYTYVIRDAGDDSGLVVDTEVVCGHARDRGDNSYSLEYALRWTCPAE